MSMRKTRTFLVTVDWKSDDWEAENIASLITSATNSVYPPNSGPEIVSIKAVPKEVHKSETKA